MPSADDHIEIDRTFERFASVDLRVETYVSEKKVFATFRIIRESDGATLGESNTTYGLNSWLDGYMIQAKSLA